MKTYQVNMIVDAEQDLWEIYRYVASFQSVERADKLLHELEQTCSHLAEMPERGHVPPELEMFEIRQYREIHWKIYRIIYEIVGEEVFIHGILDSRRDLQELLQQRLLR